MSTARSIRVRDWLAANPLIDHVLPLAAVAAWCLAAHRYVPPEFETRIAFHSGVAIVSGLVLAAATFVCALTYQASNILMTDVRRRYSTLLKRNWGSIIRASFFTAVLPICAIAADGRAEPWTIGVSIYCLGLLVGRAVRSVFWLNYTLFVAELAESSPELHRLPDALSNHGQ